MLSSIITAFLFLFIATGQVAQECPTPEIEATSPQIESNEH